MADRVARLNQQINECWNSYSDNPIVNLYMEWLEREMDESSLYVSTAAIWRFIASRNTNQNGVYNYRGKHYLETEFVYSFKQTVEELFPKLRVEVVVDEYFCYPIALLVKTFLRNE